MNIESVKSLFSLFSGEEDTDPYIPMIRLAMKETEKMLLPDADASDIRLDFLSAAIAFYRVRRIMAARDREKFVYAGKMPSSGQDSSAAYAESLLRDYLDLCSGLISSGTFVFMSFFGGKEI